MSQMMIWEADYLFSCFLTGIFLAILYDILRIIRIVLPHPLLLTGAEDAIYWLSAATVVFLALYKGNDGMIRWYAIASIAAAMFLFNYCISRFLVPLIGRLLRMPLDFLGKVLKRIRKTVTITLKNLKRRWFRGKKKAKKKEEQ